MKAEGGDAREAVEQVVELALAPREARGPTQHVLALEPRRDGAVHGHRVTPLGVSEFGQTGDLIDLYRHYGIDADAFVRACADNVQY